MLSGIININKPKNITSHDVINSLRKILGIKKIGHTGTLDPSTTGVLPVFIGKSTRLIQYIPTDKEYVAEITLGITTKTYDIDGEIVSKQSVKTDKEEILNALNSFKGEIQQEVPLTSAMHYKGKRLYTYAHKNIDIETLPVKTVTIYYIELLDMIYSDNPVIKVKVGCSTGTYIRSIANDLGKNLGYGAYLSNLTRTIASNLHIENSLTIESIQKAKESNNLEQILISPTEVINLPTMILDEEQIKKISFGQAIKANNILEQYNLTVGWGNHPIKSLKQDSKIMLLDNFNKVVGIGKYVEIDNLIMPVTVII